MKKQIVVIGLGQLGMNLAKTLNELGHDVLAIDNDEKYVQAASLLITHAVQADATDEAALRELGISNFDIAIVTIGAELEKNVLSTILLKKMGVKYIIARASNDLHRTILEKIGADKVFFPEKDMGIGMAHVLTLGDIIDYIPVVPGYGVVKLIAPPYFAGQSLSSIGFGPKNKWKVAVLLLVRGKEVIIAPSDSQVFVSEDALVLAGTWDSLEALFNEVQKQIAEKQS